MNLSVEAKAVLMNQVRKLQLTLSRQRAAVEQTENLVAITMQQLEEPNAATSNVPKSK